VLAAPLCEAWPAALERNVALSRRVSADERQRLDNAGRVFLAEKKFEGCRGLVMTDEIRCSIAGQACMMLLGLHDFYFDHVRTVLVYSGAYRATDKRFRPDEISDRLGEAHPHGPVVLSWRDALLGMRYPADRPNVVVHEFAHQLDMISEIAEGGGHPGNRRELARWRTVLLRELDRLVDESAQGRATLLDQYGTENPAEFFAVASECFFGRPVALRRRHPELYQVLSECYRLDPACWFQSPSAIIGDEDASSLGGGEGRD
jgi:Mlc titration factor MtfA (ptsG expression regulator)